MIVFQLYTCNAKYRITEIVIKPIVTHIYGLWKIQQLETIVSSDRYSRHTVYSETFKSGSVSDSNPDMNKASFTHNVNDYVKSFEHGDE